MRNVLAVIRPTFHGGDRVLVMPAVPVPPPLNDLEVGAALDALSSWMLENLAAGTSAKFVAAQGALAAWELSARLRFGGEKSSHD